MHLGTAKIGKMYSLGYGIEERSIGSALECEFRMIDI